MEESYNGLFRNEYCKKSYIIVVVCCIAAVVIGAIMGTFSPDANTSDNEVPTDAVYLNITAQGYNGTIQYENSTHYGEKM